MKRLSFLFLFFFILGFSFSVDAAGTCVQTTYVSTTVQSRVPDSVEVDLHLVCTADAGGTISYAVPSLSGATGIPGGQSANYQPFNIWGYYLYQVFRNVGSPAPSASYTTTITDVAGDALDLGLLTSNGAAAGHQITVISNNASGYPTLLSVPTIAMSGLGSGGVVLLDLVLKAY